tara:strand:- start:620 stop:964 length:345 start_codon:yes stop_codon:yes gene_type:complete
MVRDVWRCLSHGVWRQLLAVSSDSEKSSGLSGGCVLSKKAAGELRDVFASRSQDDHGLDLGVRMLGSASSEVRAEAFARVSGTITEGLSAFADVGMEMNEALDWQATAGLQWRW